MPEELYPEQIIAITGILMMLVSLISGLFLSVIFTIRKKWLKETLIREFGDF